jgi:carboxyl-terminal processing protease
VLGVLVLLASASSACETAGHPGENAGQASYEEAFVDLHDTLGRDYPCFAMKGIDWKAVGDELLPRVRQVETDDEFGRLCLELVARLEDSHASLRPGTRELPRVSFARWDPGFACLIDDRGKPVVYYVDPGGPAERAGVKVGMTVASVNGTPAEEAIKRSMQQIRRYVGYSSDRYLRYDAARHFYRQMEQGAGVRLAMHGVDGRARTFAIPATLGVRYLPRLPVPIAGVPDSANVSWAMLDGDIGYLYVRRIRADLIDKLDRAVGELSRAKGLIVDVRGNSGGGFDFARSHRNFAPDDPAEPGRPRFAGPMALLIDARCISAGEGWASWFIASKRARAFGEATAGASSRKRDYTLVNGFYHVRFPVKAYRGYLDRPIERHGLEPDVRLKQNAEDLAAGRDTVLEAARGYLVSKQAAF